MGRESGPHFRLEREAFKSGFARVCGIDEAGRGPWAGPVVAAAVILNPRRIPKGLNDSKKLMEHQREALFLPIMETAEVGVGIAEVDRIDSCNILAATLWAMGEALRALSIETELALVDGNVAPDLPCPVRTVVGGDGASLSIAAASIIAKVTRDRLMVAMDRHHPVYGFARHKGYGTPEHQAALDRHGPCVHHRRSFAPVAALLAR